MKKNSAQKTVAVFFGGNSNEHEISVITGMLAVNLLRASEFRVLPVYLPREGGMLSSEEMLSVADFREGAYRRFPAVEFGEGVLVDAKKRKRAVHIDCALNCCHGGAGEDGTLSALLRWYKIPSASPDTPISSIFMDKTISKYAVRGLGVPCALSAVVREGESGEKVAKELGYPVIVKPAHLGSSIGIKVAHNKGELKKALELAFTLDSCALLEEYFESKRDLNCAVCRVNGEVKLSPVEEVFSSEDILTFSEKYESDGARSSALPADIPAGTAKRVQNITKQIYEAFGGAGVMRADFLLVEDEVYFNELNTVPGSLSCYLFAPKLSEAKDFLVSLLEEGMKPKEEKTVVKSGILERGVFSGGKGSKRRKNLS